ncbi:MAG: hypothetical protein ACYDCO_17755 [Armatimonadota bacterium]
MKYDWDKCKAMFDVDGTLRDIYILNTTVDDWQKVLDALRACGYSLLPLQDGHAGGLPLDASAIFALHDQDQLGPSISVEDSGVTFNCHFFTKDEIEFDVDPREITSQTQFEVVLRFMQVISRATGKEAILTPENWQRYVMVRVADDNITFTGNW